MKLLSWFNKKYGIRHPGTVGLTRVPKWCKPGKMGKSIACPSCSAAQHVKTFSWKIMMCLHCKTLNKKCDWFLLGKTK